MNGIMIKKERKPMTLDRLAVSIQTDLLSLRNDMNDGFARMATKQDLADLRDEMISRFATHSELQSAIGGLRDEILEEIGKIKYAKEIDELRSRMNRVENELGIGRGGSLI
jgi:hypothetical protein